MRTLIIIIVLVVLVFLGYLFIFANTPADQNVISGIDGGPITQTGTLTCLPHLDTSGPTTMECAFGLMVDADTYYALDMSAVDPQLTDQFGTGEQVVVSGIATPRSELEANDRLLIYNIVGVIAVSSLSSSASPTALPSTDHTLSGGDISFSVPEDFGLAVSEEQILLGSSTNPCSDGFDHCLYYLGDAYTNTNFDSAGIAIVERTDLTSSTTCLTTLPDGYTSLEPTIEEAGTYSTSIFTPLQDAGAGRSASGSLYRLSYGEQCYEFETRVIMTTFSNYPAGSIDEFTRQDRTDLLAQLDNIVRSIELTSTDMSVRFPEAD